MTAINQFKIPGEYKYEVVKEFKASNGEHLPLPDLIFLGVSHSTQKHTIPPFVRSRDYQERYQIFFELRDDKVITKKRLPFIDAIPFDMEKKGWDDPAHIRLMNYLRKKLSLINVINHYPTIYTEEQFDYAKAILRPIYDHHILKNKMAIHQFPDRKKQEMSDFIESVAFLRGIINQEIKALAERNYYSRQERLCQSIIKESSGDRPSIWVAGAAHFSQSKDSTKYEQKALKLFLDTVKRTRKSAIVIIATAPVSRSSY